MENVKWSLGLSNWGLFCMYLSSVTWDLSFWGNLVQWGNLEFFLLVALSFVHFMIEKISKSLFQGLLFCNAKNHCAKTSLWHCLLFAGQWGGPQSFSKSLNPKSGMWRWRGGSPVLRFPCAINLATAWGSFPQCVRHEAGEPAKLVRQRYREASNLAVSLIRAKIQECLIFLK